MKRTEQKELYLHKKATFKSKRVKRRFVEKKKTIYNKKIVIGSSALRHFRTLFTC